MCDDRVDEWRWENFKIIEEIANIGTNNINNLKDFEATFIRLIFNILFKSN
jgi:hypothetical protein